MVRFSKIASFIIAGIIGISIGIYYNTPVSAQTPPSISNISTNASDYPNSNIPKYDKFEITFDVQTSASNLQMPYDANPPAGITPENGVSVDGLFSPDNWNTTYTQPAFYYQEFDLQVQTGRDWIYPTGLFDWKVRFAPNAPGTWQYKLKVTDKDGTYETQPASFQVIDSPNKGFITVSPNDSRYFEFEDGTYFPGLGYNMNWDHISWNNPIQENQNNFQIMGQNGIQLIRMWLSQWSIFGSQDNPWRSMGKGSGYDSLTTDPTFVYPGKDASMWLHWNADPLAANFNPAMFMGWLQQPPAVKPNTTYQFDVRYLIPLELKGPRVAGQPYGFVLKTGAWIDQPWEPGTGTVISTYETTAPSWTTLTGTITTRSNQYFFDNLYLVLENVVDGTPLGGGNYAYIDEVTIREDLGGGQLGENIVYKPSMDHLSYFQQRDSFAFDKVLELASQNNVYLRPVILEKNEYIQNHIDYNGNPVTTGSNNNFYGNWRNDTKVRWLQKAWWRYLQARWGYSPNIHSWELLNEGDPFSGLHYTLADELGKFMHQFTPNKHLVSTSMWHSFPIGQFWENVNYPDIDFSDIHRYISKSPTGNLTVRVDTPDGLGGYTLNTVIVGTAPSDFYDAASVVEKLSTQLGAKQPFGSNKPTLRGETGFTDSGTEPPTTELQLDTQGIWLHNYNWAQINPGGVIESYWYDYDHIAANNGSFDFRPQFKSYYNFIIDKPLSNGNYVDIAAQFTDQNLRVLGQKDLAYNNAHFWVQNKNHTWKNVVDGVLINPINDSITISGFVPNTQFIVNQWDTYNSGVIGTQTISSDQNGDIAIPIINLVTDTAFSLSPESPITPTPACNKINGDADCNGTVDLNDFIIWKNEFINGGSLNADFDGNGSVNLNDFISWKNGFIAG